MTPQPRRPAWVAPSLLVAAFAVVVLMVRLFGQDGEQSAFPTQQVPEPSSSLGCDDHRDPAGSRADLDRHRSWTTPLR
jgi:hypothetical protein